MGMGVTTVKPRVMVLLLVANFPGMRSSALVKASATTVVKVSPRATFAVPVTAVSTEVTTSNVPAAVAAPVVTAPAVNVKF